MLCAKLLFVAQARPRLVAQTVEKEAERASAAERIEATNTIICKDCNV